MSAPTPAPAPEDKIKWLQLRPIMWLWALQLRLPSPDIETSKQDASNAVHNSKVDSKQFRKLWFFNFHTNSFLIREQHEIYFHHHIIEKINFRKKLQINILLGIKLMSFGLNP